MSATIDILSITTPLPATSFGVSGISGEEELNRPFSYTVSLHSGTALLDPNSLLDQPVTITLANPEGHGRYISGIVSSVRQMPYASNALWRYQLTVVPKLWFLGQTQDCRFYQKMTVPDIMAVIFGKFNVTYTSKLQNTYTARDYTVQFNESYLDFVQRMLEDEGIFYFFTHDASGHTLILADSNTAFQPITLPSVILDQTGQGFGTMNTWEQTDSTAIGSVRVDDYRMDTNSLAPGAITGTETTVLKASAANQRTHYTWPAVRGTTQDAQARAKWRMLAAEAAAQTLSGSGQMPHFISGGKFSLTNDPLNNGDPSDYIIHSVSYQVSDTSDGSSGSGGSSIAMSCRAIPAATPYRAEPTVAPPIMSGLYSAKVIGASSEEIYTDTDDFGRIQVQFPADNQGDITTEKTLWVRVVQSWAGNNWGMQFIPRIGMEVAIAFMEGDVNHPVAVGCLYNSDNSPTFAAADKNKSGLRTHSTKGGGTSNFNELSFDDTMGSEVFFLHAEKDYKLEVEHDQTLTIQNDRNLTVTKDETVKIDGKKTDTVKGDHTLTVSEGNLSTTVSQGNESLTVSTGSISHTAGQSITLQVGGNTLVINTSGITLTVGANSVQLSESGVTINGIQVNITGQASTGVTGTGMLNLTGGLVNINS
ncbi:type VI secretion protein [Acidocella aquatica]|uniref:Type VI secretion protein n=1 Tax=Acidocella aquatica TaxID=1922313 RepID=A0ABQ6A2Y6_9PROT|nr:type VI secretion system tip protein TssI/VgrG [Acidocella aquatica]GLR65667.1 type VI secretion protein [Acidocella aquatica]